MPVSPTYPGVYIQEIPSGVRTIVGVSTSIGMFIGRTSMGELNKPTMCLSYEEFVREFESSPDSELAAQVRLFFANGGKQCYVTRIAKGAKPASVVLSNEAMGPVLRATAKTAGLFGNDIRLSVNYNTLEPEATFNLEVFRWVKTRSGVLQKSMVENHIGLSMDPNHPRYAPDIVTQSSNLISLSTKDETGAELTGLAAAKGQGYSQSGFAVSASTNAVFRNQWKSIIGENRIANRFMISVDGNGPVLVDLFSLDFEDTTHSNPLKTNSDCRTNLPGRIQDLINSELPTGASVTVKMEAGPVGESENSSTVLMRIITDKDGGDVKIYPASVNDLAAPLMLGTAQGGIEVSGYAGCRPAPTGWLFKIDQLNSFAELQQNAFDKLVIDGVEIDVGPASPNKIATTTNTSVTSPRMYQDASAETQNDGRDGLREKLAILARAVNAKRAELPDFTWTAEVWGSRLALIATGGPDSKIASVSTLKTTTPGVLISTPLTNVRYYNLGATLGSPAYFSGGVSGIPGSAPGVSDYQDIYPVIDREVDLFNLMILPKDNGTTDATRRKLWGPASAFCQKRRAFLLIDPPDDWKNKDDSIDMAKGVNSLRVGLVKDHSAVFFPNLRIDDNGRERVVSPSGAVAGLMARIDSTRGVWKASAGMEADLRGLLGLEHRFSDDENGQMNPKAVNALRVFPSGVVSWGARTMDGDDSFGSEYKYIPIRRLALFIEESLYRGTQWAVFEPNDEPLWAQIRLNLGAFMHNLFTQGAFQGKSKNEAYYVKCDSDTTTQNDINLGIVNIEVGFAPLKPAEFVIIKLQQMAGQIQA